MRVALRVAALMLVIVALMAVSTLSLAGCASKTTATSSSSPSSSSTQAVQQVTTSMATQTSVPVTKVTGTMVFHAGWGEALGEFGTKPVEGSPDVVPPAFWVTPDERLFILDPINHRVQVIDPQGKVERSIPIEARNPVDVAVAPDGTLLISDFPDFLQAYSQKGELLAQYAEVWYKAIPIRFIVDESTVYVVYPGADEPSLKYVPVYRDGRLLDPRIEWATASLYQPLSHGLSMQRQGPAARADSTEVELASGIVYVYSDGQVLFATTLSPPPLTTLALALDDGTIALSKDIWLPTKSFPPIGAEEIWVLSESGSLLSQAEWQSVPVEGIYGIGQSRLTPGGFLYKMLIGPEGISVLRCAVR
jgi:hypothetical protein